MAKVFWLGRHSARPELGAPVSKIHAAGLSLLKCLGWEQVANDTLKVPVFAFTTRKGANYPPDQPDLPTVRQLPHANTACLDDKRKLQQQLRSAGQQQLLPTCWDSLEDFMSWLTPQLRSQTSNAGLGPRVGNQGPEQHDRLPEPKPDPRCSRTADSVNPAGTPAGSDANSSSQPHSASSSHLPGGTYFIKHRCGVKGQAVYPVHSLEQLQQLQDKLQKSNQDFVVQQEVPPMLLDGRKFVLRVHVLVTISPLLVYLHEDVIVIKHACGYAPCSSNVAAHVSSKGSKHPAPCLLASIPELHSQVWPQLQQLAVQSILAVKQALKPQKMDPSAVLYHLFGYDCMVDSKGQVVLLEVNSYPAIASGTMAAVDAGVYTRLLHDMVKLLVLPLTDKVEPAPGGFVLLHP